MGVLHKASRGFERLHETPKRRGHCKTLGTLNTHTYTYIHIWVFFSYRYGGMLHEATWYFEGILISPMQRKLWKNPQGLCTHIHKQMHILVFFPTPIGGASQSPERRDFAKADEQMGLCTHIHTFQSFILQIWGCLVKPQWESEWEMGVKHQKISKNCKKCADLHRKSCLLTPTVMGLGWSQFPKIFFLQGN